MLVLASTLPLSTVLSMATTKLGVILFQQPEKSAGQGVAEMIIYNSVARNAADVECQKSKRLLEKNLKKLKKMLTKMMT